MGGRERCHEGTISAACYDHTTETLITGGFDRKVRLWNLDGRALGEIASQIPKGFADAIRTLCIVPGGATGHQGGEAEGGGGGGSHLWLSAADAIPQVYDVRSRTRVTRCLPPTPLPPT